MKFRKRWSGRILIYSAVATLCFAANHLFLDKTNLRAITPLSVNRTVELLTPTSTPPAQISTRAFSASCRPYSVIDNRSFFEREPPQVHLPRLASKSYRYHLLKTLRSFRLVAVACAYNVEKEIPKFRSYVERIIHVFHSSSRILIFESDSTDDTLATLRKWSSAQIYTGGRLEPTIPARSERIAYCRNILLEKARMLEPDYLLTLDLDIFAAKLSAFLTNFDYETEDWSVMTGNVVRDYYDIWALRTLSDLNLNYDVWERVQVLMRAPSNYCGQSVIDQVVGIHQKHIPISRGLLEVRSAFSGAALYKMNSTKNCWYSGANATSEHVPFHLCIREKNGARIFINPKFRICLRHP
ncbi:unnamed protein product [Rotaria sp. Silwood2]|nr:unnamed protein product [Rotaria sp. Silwood2]CAF3262312.1 unnamed protein product [Rotaria sp. Silwood2]CAF4007320.1 unnamed protein product [Rotaria sp. Silwood2]CAF4007335.1 unnamed protein product [Rotaria sp. Silwood2]CAF4095650.1 unnamed protein product [Rotaria sp. Silwood2]